MQICNFYLQINLKSDTCRPSGSRELVVATWEVVYTVCLVFKQLGSENTAARQRQHGRQLTPRCSLVILCFAPRTVDLFIRYAIKLCRKTMHLQLQYTDLPSTEKWTPPFLKTSTNTSQLMNSSWISNYKVVNTTRGERSYGLRIMVVLKSTDTWTHYCSIKTHPQFRNSLLVLWDVNPF